MMRAPVAVVTGSGKRLGRQIAIALAKEGFDIVAHYHSSSDGVRHTKKAIESAGRRVLIVKADLRKPAQIKILFKKAKSSFGRVDLVVNNAAIFPTAVDFLKMTDKLWNDVVNVNLTSVMHCCRETASLMQKSGGQIINIASLGAFLSWRNYIHYNVAKSGVVQLTLVLAKALAPGIRVNAIAPGTIIMPGEETTEEHHPSVEKIPLKRYGSSTDITDAVVYLAKSSYVTGEIIRVDGGVTLR